MKLSIIVPVYNVEKYLEKCLDSLLNQDINNYEIICINDGSTDNSLKILERYKLKDSCIKIINQKNKGQSVARNLGLMKSNGEYVLFVDSDDFIEKNILNELYKVSRTNNLDILDFNAHLYKGGVKTIYFNQTLVTKRPIHGKDYFNQFVRKYKKHPFISPWSHLFRRDFLIEKKLNFIEFRVYEDIPFTFLTYYYAERVMYLDKTIYNYRYNFESTTKSKINKKKIVDLIFIAKEISHLSEEKKNTIPMDNFVSGHKGFIIQLLKDKEWSNYKYLYKPNVFLETHYHLLHTKNRLIISISKLNFKFFVLYCRLIRLIK